ncbi:MAG: 4-hydroxy-tetrahydrodipicolinate reductase [Candidatus Omnitrophica bacterium]|nr:4-hydroxy-tetrahydrodipicolinate reductase [Candidatus Omnitrophota bacterium]
MIIRLAIAGCCGRMGQAIARCALRQPERFTLTAALEVPGHAQIGCEYIKPNIKVTDNTRAAFEAADAVIEFSTPEASIEHAQLAQKFRKAMVIGTTGFSQAQQETLRLISKHTALVVSPNMSLGMNLLFELAQLAAQRLGLLFDVEVLEAHHRQKKDSPSGTAKRLAEHLAAARKQPVVSIPIHAQRAGDIVGDHTVLLAGPSERLELTHRAHSREVFAEGALLAARFVVGQAPGLYDMSHVLKAGIVE